MLGNAKHESDQQRQHSRGQKLHKDKCKGQRGLILPPIFLPPNPQEPTTYLIEL